MNDGKITSQSVLVISLLLAIIAIVITVASISKSVYTPIIVGTKECVQIINGYNEKDNGLYCRYEGGGKMNPPKYYISLASYEYWIEVPYELYLKAKSIKWIDTKFTRVY